MGAREAAGRWLATVAAGDFLFGTGLAAAALGTDVTTLSPAVRLLIAVAAGTAWAVLIAAGGGYDEWHLRMGRVRIRPVIDAGLWVAAAVLMASYILKVAPAREALVLSAPLAVAGSLVLHRMAVVLAGQQARSGLRRRACVVAGDTADVRALLDHIRRSAPPGLEVTGVCCENADGPMTVPEGIQVHHDARDVIAVARSVGADMVIVAGELAHGPLRAVLADAAGCGIDLMVAPTCAELAGPRARTLELGGLPLLNARRANMGTVALALKTAVDRTGALLALLVLAPVMFGIAVAIRWCDYGPIFFTQTRVGRDGKPFRVFKFRTMYTGADGDRRALEHLNEHDGPLFKIRRDPRITPVGRVLRRLSLDELPQLLNVLGGSMSLVGPRPPLPREVETYDQETRRRLAVKPGLTGLWQVSGRSNLSWSDSIYYDLQYVDHWSLGLDLRVLWRTVQAVVSGRGAY